MVDGGWLMEKLSRRLTIGDQLSTNNNQLFPSINHQPKTINSRFVVRPSTINQQPSTLLSRPRSTGSLGGGRGNRLRRRIAEREQGAFGFLFFLRPESGHGLAKRFHAKVLLATGALDAIEERGQINHLAARLEEVKVQHLLSRHALHGI